MHSASPNYHEQYEKTLAHLRTRKRVLFLTTSNRWVKEKTKPKSTLLAEALAQKLGPKTQLTSIDVSKLKIYDCEGNVSSAKGNDCGVGKALLKDSTKNPTGFHRCWASVNNPDDELWQVSKALLASDTVLFFGPVRWGQMNAVYQRLIERLTWIENRHSTLGENNIVQNIEAGIITIGQNWRGEEVVAVQKKVLNYFGFRVIDELCWHWQFTDDSNDESNRSYLEASHVFAETFLRNDLV